MDADCEDAEATTTIDDLEISRLVWEYLQRKAEMAGVDPRHLIADVIARWVCEELLL